MLKRGQVTIYLLLGIVMLIAFSFLSYTNNKYENKPVPSLPSDVIPIKSYIESCVKSVVDDGLLRIGLQGGYYKLPERYFSTIYSDAPYFYYRGGIDVIKPYKIKTEFSNYLEENIDKCTNLSNFENHGFQIEQADKKITADMENSTLKIRIDYPLKVARGGNTIEINDISYNKNINFKNILLSANGIVLKTFYEPDYIPTSYLLDLMEQYDLQIDTMVENSTNTVLYVISDNKEMISGVPFTFLFATKTSS